MPDCRRGWRAKPCRGALGAVVGRFKSKASEARAASDGCIFRSNPREPSPRASAVFNKGIIEDPTGLNTARIQPHVEKI